MGERRRFDPTVLLRCEDSAGAVSVIENRVPGRWEGPPVHHHDFDEAFYVLEGELTFLVEDDLFTATAGELAFARGGAHHTLANLSEHEPRYLLVSTPAGFERYFDRIAAANAGVDPPESALEPIPETTVVGPTIGETREAGTADGAGDRAGPDQETHQRWPEQGR
jgi:hypothetical protein